MQGVVRHKQAYHMRSGSYCQAVAPLTRRKLKTPTLELVWPPYGGPQNVCNRRTPRATVFSFHRENEHSQGQAVVSLEANRGKAARNP